MLSEDLFLDNKQLIIEPGEYLQLKVEIEVNGQTQVLIDRQGGNFFPNTAPAEISQLLRPHF